VRDPQACVDFRRPVQTAVPGAQGRVLAVLAETMGELSLRTVARFAEVSPRLALLRPLASCRGWFSSASSNVETPTRRPSSVWCRKMWRPSSCKRSAARATTY
jgi:hypothetical protein